MIVNAPEGQKTMTVGQLVEALSAIDPALDVRTEGCDCDGECLSVSVEGGYKDAVLDIPAHVYLGRARRAHGQDAEAAVQGEV